MTPGEIAARAAEVARDISARGHQLCFEYAGVSIAYGSDESATGEWIRTFFEGYFLSSGAGDMDAAVYSTADPALFAALQELVPGEESAVGKRDYAEMPFTDSVALVRRVADKVRSREDVFLLLFTESRTIVLVTSGNVEVRREEGMQILRALNKWLLLEQGWIPMHSACAAKNGRTICIAGGKASGKTSTLLNLLARNGCDLAAVDKFLIRDGGSGLEVCGIPGKIGIRVGTAIVQPQVLTWLTEATAPFFPNIGLDDVQQIAATNTPEQLRTRKEKIHMTPAELAALFGGSITPAAPLGLLLTPVFDLSLEDSRLVRTEPEEAIRLLTECYVSLLSKWEGFLLHFFDLTDARLEERLATALGRHLPGVPGYEVHQNHRTNERTAELVAGLL
jgi:hypothetical protein